MKGTESRREKALMLLITENFLPNLPKIVDDMVRHNYQLTIILTVQWCGPSITQLPTFSLFVPTTSGNAVSKNNINSALLRSIQTFMQ